MTIGEPVELLGLSAKFLLRYCGLREVFRVPVATNRGCRSGEVLAGLDGALAAAREHGAEEFLLALRWGSRELLRSRLRESPLPVRLYLWYINNWSLGFDINILARTCFEVLRDHAY